MVWFGMVWFFVFQLVKVVLVSIRTKFELSMCLVCPTIDINMRIGQPQNVGLFSRLPFVERESSVIGNVTLIDCLERFFISSILHILISIVGHTRHLESYNLVCMLTKTSLTDCHIKNKTKPY